MRARTRRTASEAAEAHQPGDRAPHAANYETVDQWLERDDCPCPCVDLDEMRRLNEVWEVQWYPSTPIGSHRVAASTLELALARALELERED